MFGCVWSRKGAAQPNTEEKMSEVVPIRKFDDTVIGVGIGSATVYHLAREVGARCIVARITTPECYQPLDIMP